VNTFKLLSYEGKYEKQLGIKTHSIVNLDNLTLAGESTIQNHHYQGASYFILFSIFNELPHETKKFPLIDYGCGKGRALFVAEQCGFTNLIGVDIAKELIDNANENKTIYKKKMMKVVSIFYLKMLPNIKSQTMPVYFTFQSLWRRDHAKGYQ